MGEVMTMPRRVSAMLKVLALILIAAVSVASVVYVAGRMLSALLGFVLLVWAVIA